MILARLTEMSRMVIPRIVKTATQCRPAKRLMSNHCGSPFVLAASTTRSGSNHSACASMKSMPYLSSLAVDLAGSQTNNSNDMTFLV